MLTTTCIILIALSAAFSVLALDLLIDNFSIDRLLVFATFLMSTVTLLLTMNAYLRRRR